MIRNMTNWWLYNYPKEKKVIRNTPPKPWEETMTKKEAEWCLHQIEFEIDLKLKGTYHCAGGKRAARIWKSSQRRRFRNIEREAGGSPVNWIAKKWNWRKFRFDKYLLGYSIFWD
jgi:hypothetical protein